MKLFIGCSSSNDIPTEYFNDCKVLLEELMKENDLVFGACNSGLMGLAYNTTLKANGNITGICPEAYKDDFKTLKCDTEITTKSVSERTDTVISSSDALIFLPGGIGTIYELFTAIESKRCHEFNKPIVIYNSNGYFDKLLEFMDKVYSEKFSGFKDKRNYLVTDSISSILYYINNYKKIKETETTFGYSYEEFSEMYKKTNGFSETSDEIDPALIQFIREEDRPNVLKKVKKDDSKH
ncbi:MAG: LOG family protein [Clostridium sp.]|jgi:uncharacterized protein (TIGR00730 family)|nr:LOG family protein [Clostridium sp.]